MNTSYVVQENKNEGLKVGWLIDGRSVKELVAVTDEQDIESRVPQARTHLTFYRLIH